MCGKLSRLFLVFFFFALFFLGQVSGQDTSTSSETLTGLPLPTNENSTSLPAPVPFLNPDGTINWKALDEASQLLWQTAEESANSVDGLLASLKDWQTQYTNLLLLVKETDKAYQLELRATRNWGSLWRDVAFVGLGCGVGGMIGSWESLGYGALAGLACAGINEFGRLIGVWQ